MSDCLRSAESSIFNSMLTNSDQTHVNINQVIAVLQRLLAGVFAAAAVERAVHAFAAARGLVSELALMDKSEFKLLVHRIVADWVEKHIHKTFDRAVKLSDTDGDHCMSKAEIIELLRKFAVGEALVGDVVAIPAVATLFT